MNITNLVKDRTAKFDHYRNGMFYYTIQTEDELFKFGIPVEDISGATLPAEDKAIYFMRWIRKWVGSKFLDSVVLKDDKDGSMTVINLEAVKRINFV